MKILFFANLNIVKENFEIQNFVKTNYDSTQKLNINLSIAELFLVASCFSFDALIINKIKLLKCIHVSN